MNLGGAQLRLATDQPEHDHKSVGAYISPTAAPLDSDSGRQELFTLPADSEAALYVVPKLFCFVNQLFNKENKRTSALYSTQWCLSHPDTNYTYL